MEWTIDNAGERYTRMQGTCVAKVWYTAVDHWSGSVSRARASIGQHHFSTLQDAQSWCEARLREFIADGHCGVEARKPPL